MTLRSIWHMVGKGVAFLEVGEASLDSMSGSTPDLYSVTWSQTYLIKGFFCPLNY